MNPMKPHQTIAHVVSLYDDLLGAMAAEVAEQSKRADRAEAEAEALRAEVAALKAERGETKP